MELTLIRHFKTPGNLKGCYIGRTDEPLAPGIKPDREYPVAEIIIGSPMKRCIETAGLIYLGQELILCKELKECDFGLFEGLNYEELKDHPDYQQWLAARGTIAFPQGECPADFKERCVNGFERMVELLLRRECQKAAMIVHGGTIMAVLERFDREKRAFYSWQAENGGGYQMYLDQVQWQQENRQLTEIKKL